MKRGDIVTVAAKGHYSGKPRPALVIQSDLFSELPSVTIALVTSEIIEAPLLRFTIAPSDETGLQRTSQIMIDKLVTVPRTDIGKVIGAIDDESMLAVERLLALFLGIARPAEKRRGLKK